MYTHIYTIFRGLNYVFIEILLALKHELIEEILTDKDTSSS